MRTRTFTSGAIILAAALMVGAPGCYTILAVDEAPRAQEIAPLEAAPAVDFVLPPPPPAPIYVPATTVRPSSPTTPIVTEQRTSGPQRGRTEPAPASSSSEQRPVRTGRTR